MTRLNDAAATAQPSPYTSSYSLDPAGAFTRDDAISSVKCISRTPSRSLREATFVRAPSLKFGDAALVED